MKVVLWAFVLACVAILVMFRVQPVRADDGHDGGGHDGGKSGSHPVVVVTQRSDSEPQTGDGGGDDGAGAGETENGRRSTTAPATPPRLLLGLIGAGALGLSLALAGGAREWRRRPIR